MTRNKGCSQTLYASAPIWSNSGMWVTPSPREAIWLFPFPFSLSKAEMPSLGTTCCPQSPAGSRDTRGSAAAADVPSVGAGQAAQEADPAQAGSWEGATRRQQEGATTQIQPTVPESSFGNCFIISKRKPSAAHTTGLS